MSYIKNLRTYVGKSPIIAPGSAIILLNSKQELLLQLRSDTNDWGVPGGGMELGDSFEETARRELMEETGLTATTLELIGLVSGKDMYFKYPHGDEVYNATAIYKAEKISGELKTDEESLQLAYFPLTALPKFNAISQKILEEIGYLK